MIVIVITTSLANSRKMTPRNPKRRVRGSGAQLPHSYSIAAHTEEADSAAVSGMVGVRKYIRFIDGEDHQVFSLLAALGMLDFHGPQWKQRLENALLRRGFFQTMQGAGKLRARVKALAGGRE